MIFVDTNILMDLNQPASPWRGWSEDRIAERDDDLVVNQVVLAKLARSYDTLEAELNFIEALAIDVVPFDATVAFRAGQVHAAYRAAGGACTGILADFLIGAYASVLDAQLLTRDRQRFAAYFPDLTLITPETTNG